MCGRYALHANPEVVALQFGLVALPQLEARYNIRPGMEILAVHAARERRVATRHYWGIAGRLANARAETIEQKPAFRDAFLRQRCIVPASGFYEWKSSGRRKYPWYFRPIDAPLFGLAGIRALWRGQHAVSLITTAPNALLQSIHDRMPVIVAPENYGAWLEAGDATLRGLLLPYPAERMAAHPVSARVNRPEIDDAALVEPSDDGPPQRDLL